MAKIGRKNAVLFGLILVSASTVGIGILELIKDWRTFFGLTIVFRMMHGYANALCLSALYSITS